eukprot:CAMPEP_0174253538 /NCGR_PEP_ID=MMETSP0439-20130205/2899_1 /TAXON_ID=0 /ORGANISM="Stereomyxa ramosa, Strain Chinc5" /LENGTH=112 /DNA_ID=CAMNT_0015334611 /DNA_START=68 /DNA_END=407 /DNA_ORIENTATION=+
MKAVFFAFVLFAAVVAFAIELENLIPVTGGEVKRAACTSNPCGSSETCCVVTGDKKLAALPLMLAAALMSNTAAKLDTNALALELALVPLAYVPLAKPLVDNAPTTKFLLTI